MPGSPPTPPPPPPPPPPLPLPPGAGPASRGRLHGRNAVGSTGGKQRCGWGDAAAGGAAAAALCRAGDVRQEVERDARSAAPRAGAGPRRAAAARRWAKWARLTAPPARLWRLRPPRRAAASTAGAWCGGCSGRRLPRAAPCCRDGRNLLFPPDVGPFTAKCTPRCVRHARRPWHPPDPPLPTTAHHVPRRELRWPAPPPRPVLVVAPAWPVPPPLPPATQHVRFCRDPPSAAEV